MGMTALREMTETAIQDSLYSVLPPFSKYHLYSDDAASGAAPPSYDDLEVLTLRPISQRKPSLQTLGSGSEDSKTLAESEPALNCELHKLPKAYAPVLIEVHILKNSPQSREKSEEQRILNEYTCGDTVYGYVELENTSFRPVSFETVSVTLEGNVVVFDSQSGSRRCRNILKVTDTQSDSAGVQRLDNLTLYGLPESKILQPHVKYRRCFAFKIPDRLMEENCPQGNMLQSGLPPSLGLDRCHGCFKYRGLTINQFLGYAKARERGSPMGSTDFAQDISISYAIEAILVGKDSKRQKFHILQECECFLRIIPHNVGTDVYNPGEDLEILEKATGSPLKTWKDDWKVNTTAIDVLSTYSEGKIAVPGFVDQEISYKIDLHSKFKKKLRFSRTCPKYKKSFDSSGKIILSSEIPKLALPYRSPTLITKDNLFKNKSQDDQENRLKIQGAVASDRKTPLKEITLEITCIPSQNCKGRKPPNIRAVKAELICITGKSREQIPEDICNASILDQSRMHAIGTLCGPFLPAVEAHRETINQHQIKAQNRENENLVSIHPQLEVEELEDLDIKVDHLRDVFVNRTNKKKWLSKLFAKGMWVPHGAEFKRRIVVSLDYSRNFRGTLVPDFMNSLCFRAYFVRVVVSFEDGVGEAALRIPIKVQNTFFS